ncbi:hypothetical protein HYE01_00875 [Mycoplasmopsis bovis]|nr:hypothetical protein HYE01_00875 [Mycoplasmopsis bovis]
MINIDLSNAESVDFQSFLLLKKLMNLGIGFIMKKLKKKKSYWFASISKLTLTKANNELRQELSRTIIWPKRQNNKIRATN